MQQEFGTERLILKPRVLSDFGKCVEMDMDTEVTKYIPGVYDGSEKHLSFLRERILQSYGEGLGYWSIFLRNTPVDFLGWVHLLSLPDDKQAAEIGWRLKRSAWGKGYATEAARVILVHAFETVGSDRVVACTHTDNNRSKRVMERLGFDYITDFIYDGKIPSSLYEMKEYKCFVRQIKA